MKVVKAGHERIYDKDFVSPLQKIERIARICYKSEEMITKNSYLNMTKKLLERQHMAMFEHASLVFEVDEITYQAIEDAITTMTSVIDDVMSIMNICRIRKTRTCISATEERFVISANIRAYYEFFTKAVEFRVHNDSICNLYWKVNSRIDNIFEIPEYDVPAAPWSIKEVTDITKLTWPERLIHETVSVIFTCDRGVTHELVRMRDSSFAQESTRYCNYQLGKFGKEITVIEPCFFKKGTVGYLKWADGCEYTEKAYFALLDGGATPQEARTVLPQSVKADIALTTNLYEWRHILNLRACDATGPAHPQMKEVMVPLFLEFKEEYAPILTKLELPENK